MPTEDVMAVSNSEPAAGRRRRAFLSAWFVIPAMFRRLFNRARLKRMLIDSLARFSPPPCCM
jgi:hypothetical protein